jgi:hypothetical protein
MRTSTVIGFANSSRSNGFFCLTPSSPLSINRIVQLATRPREAFTPNNVRGENISPKKHPSVGPDFGFFVTLPQKNAISGPTFFNRALSSDGARFPFGNF